MNIIKTSEYEDGYTCPICLEKFKETEVICLIKHHCDKPEKIENARKRKHIFHKQCIMEHIEKNNEDDSVRCPLDRDKIYCLVNVKYNELVTVNIINFSHNYYELLDKCKQNGTICVSIIDHINLNYKDINGKTLLYCACQRGNLTLVKKLIKFGANPAISDDNGFTPLMAVICHNYLSIVKYLLTLDIIKDTINYVDNKGYSALKYSLCGEKYACMREILKIIGSDGHNRTIIEEVYDKIRLIRCNDSQIVRTKLLLMKLLNIRHNKKIKMVIKMKKVKHTQTISDKTPDRDRVLDINIVDNPELLDIMYRPPSNNTYERYIPPPPTDDEIKKLQTFEHVKPDFLYTK